MFGIKILRPLHAPGKPRWGVYRPQPFAPTEGYGTIFYLVPGCKTQRCA